MFSDDTAVHTDDCSQEKPGAIPVIRDIPIDVYCRQTYLTKSQPSVDNNGWAEDLAVR